MISTLAASLACAVHRQPVIPYRSLSEPDDIIHYTIPPNCVWAYKIEAPHTREAIGVMYCWGRA